MTNEELCKKLDRIPLEHRESDEIEWCVLPKSTAECQTLQQLFSLRNTNIQFTEEYLIIYYYRTGPYRIKLNRYRMWIIQKYIESGIRWTRQGI